MDSNNPDLFDPLTLLHFEGSMYLPFGLELEHTLGILKSQSICSKQGLIHNKTN